MRLAGRWLPRFVDGSLLGPWPVAGGCRLCGGGCRCRAGWLFAAELSAGTHEVFGLLFEAGHSKWNGHGSPARAKLVSLRDRSAVSGCGPAPVPLA